MLQFLCCVLIKYFYFSEPYEIMTNSMKSNKKFSSDIQNESKEDCYQALCRLNKSPNFHMIVSDFVCFFNKTKLNTKQTIKDDSEFDDTMEKIQMMKTFLVLCALIFLIMFTNPYPFEFVSHFLILSILHLISKVIWLFIWYFYILSFICFSFVLIQFS